VIAGVRIKPSPVNCAFSLKPSRFYNRENNLDVGLKGIELDLCDDGGVVLTVSEVMPIACAALSKGDRVNISFVGRYETNGEEFDSNSDFTFTIGNDEVINGLEMCVKKLQVGQTGLCKIRHDYAYGQLGLMPKIPPYSSLKFTVRLISVDTSALLKHHGYLALPSSTSSVGVSTLILGGSPLKLDALGPMVVNTDGSLSRIGNWSEMTELEQQKTLRLIAKRNKKRAEK
jgi:hypothetical protein